MRNLQRIKHHAGQLRIEHLSRNFDNENEEDLYANLGFPKEYQEIFLECESYHPQLLDVKRRNSYHDRRCMDFLMDNLRGQALFDFFNWVYYFCGNQDEPFSDYELKTILFLCLMYENGSDDALLHQLSLDLLRVLFSKDEMMALKGHLINRMLRIVVGTCYPSEFNIKFMLVSIILKDVPGRRNLWKYFKREILFDQQCHLQQIINYHQINILEELYTSKMITGTEALKIARVNYGHFSPATLRFYSLLSRDEDMLVKQDLLHKIYNNILCLNKNTWQMNVVLGMMNRVCPSGILRSVILRRMCEDLDLDEFHATLIINIIKDKNMNLDNRLMRALFGSALSYVTSCNDETLFSLKSLASSFLQNMLKHDDESCGYYMRNHKSEVMIINRRLSQLSI